MVRASMALLLLLASSALAQEDAAPSTISKEAWAVRMARMEGASINVEEAARELGATATRISDSGRLQGLSELVADATQLNRRVVSLSLAAEVMAEPE